MKLLKTSDELISHMKIKGIKFNIAKEEDGYDIIRRFITKYERSCQNIQKHKSSEYCRELIEKYYPYFPAWVFVDDRVIKNKEYFEKNECIKTAYIFVKKVIYFER